MHRLKLAAVHRFLKRHDRRGFQGDVRLRLVVEGAFEATHVKVDDHSRGSRGRCQFTSGPCCAVHGGMMAMNEPIRIRTAARAAAIARGASSGRSGRRTRAAMPRIRAGMGTRCRWPWKGATHLSADGGWRAGSVARAGSWVWCWDLKMVAADHGACGRERGTQGQTERERAGTFRPKNMGGFPALHGGAYPRTLKTHRLETGATRNFRHTAT